MDIVYIVQRKPQVRGVVQGKRQGQPLDPLPLPAYCFKAVDTRTGDYLGEFDTEADAQALCDHLNAQLPQNQIQ
jgi:hypothetical protein